MSSTVERKLAAIMFTDIAGYTDQMSKSESKTLSLLEKKRSILTPLLKEHKGTFVKEIGDGTLTYFDSAVEAATCAVKLQETTYDDSDMNIRAGIHIGDIVFKDGDVFGDGVNVASRLESLAPSGGVCVSKNVFDELLNQDDFDGIELGLQALKGVGRLVEVFGLKGNKLNEPNPDEYQENKIDKHSDDEVPSIAIIPFENKGAEEDVFYAYGISADLISDCSSAGIIRVAGLKDIEKLDYTNLQYEELSEKLLTRYIAQGTLWKTGDIFQLSIELYDTKDKKVIWLDRWQEKWESISSIKNLLSNGLLKVLNSKLKSLQTTETSDAVAYEYYLKAKYKFIKRANSVDIDISRTLLNRALKIDSNFLLAKIFYARTWLGPTTDKNFNIQVSLDLYNEVLEQARQKGNKHIVASALNGIGGYYFYKAFNKDFSNQFLDQGLEYAKEALEIFSELDDIDGVGKTLTSMSTFYLQKNEFQSSLKYANDAYSNNRKINSVEGMGHNLHVIGSIYRSLGDMDKAIDSLLQSIKIREQNNLNSSLKHSLLAMGHVLHEMGSYHDALNYYNDSLKIFESLGEREDGPSLIYKCIANTYFMIGDYLKSKQYLEKSIALQKQKKYKHIELESMALLCLLNNKLKTTFSIKKINDIIKRNANTDIMVEVNFQLYLCLNDMSYLKNAFKQVQEKIDNLQPALAAKFLAYPTPKAIVEEYNKVFKL